MNKTTFLLVFLACTMACHDLDTGESPTIPSSFSVEARGENQLEVKWDPGSDDFLTPPELTYHIWIGKVSDGGVDADASPDFSTNPGALSYNVFGLDSETEYEVLVRSRDGGLYSENTQTNTKTTGDVAGDFTRLITLEDTAVDGLVSGDALIGGEDEIGVIIGSNLDWYTWTNNTLTLSNDERFEFSASISEAHLVKVAGNNRDDLFVVTGSTIQFYENDDSNGFEPNDPPEGFDGTPVNGSLDFVFDGGFDLFTYVGNEDTGGVRGWIYRYEDDPNTEADDPSWIEKANVNLFDSGTETKTRMRAGYVDGDENPDLVVFRDGVVYYLQGEEEDEDGFTFASERELFTVTPFTQTVGGQEDRVDYNSSTTEVTLTLHNGDDSNLDIYLFVRDMTQDLTQLLVFKGDGDGNFENAVRTDFDQALFNSGSSFVNADGDVNGVLELLIPQTSSNNVGVFSGSNEIYSTVAYYSHGTETAVDFAVYADLADDGGPFDLVLASEDGLHALIWE